MKKTYVKPMIQFEDFKIASNIALTCENKVSTNQASCAVEFDEGFAVFTDANEFCTKKDSYDTCYHIPMASPTLFGS